MPAKPLAAPDIGLPRFEPLGDSDGDVFSLSSHRRARAALEFGLAIPERGFNIFVLGEDRSGRMTATMAFLLGVTARRPPPDDWLYLANFQETHRPVPYRLPAGVGRRFRDRMAQLVAELRDALARAFSSAAFQSQLQTRSEGVTSEVRGAIEGLKREANAHGLDLVETPQGGIVVSDSAPAGADGAGPPAPPDAFRQELGERLLEVHRAAAQRRAELFAWMRQFEREVADQQTRDLIDALVRDFAAFPAITAWLEAMRQDMLSGLGRFRPDAENLDETPEQRYAANLIVDHGEDRHPGVVLEANPTYENLFGRIEYQQVQGVLRTHFSLIRPGALHRANGGVLVLRADALAADPEVWRQLKAALRDGEIRVEEPHREKAVPVAGAPQPEPIPLDVKVVLVGAPKWYYGVYGTDPDFYSYFKVKADIDPDMDATQANIDCYAALIQRMARAHAGAACEPAALQRLLGVAGRWSGQRDKLTARFELIEDLLSEAHALADGATPRCISEEDVVQAMAQRRRRNARAEDRFQESVARGTILIATAGSAVGQVNALTVHSFGDHEFGAPSRITARASIGRHGVINIEREAAMSGPIQQKGVMGLEGFLAGHFARRFPLSFNCSLTFEQNYGGVEGDSASLAELLAILSALSGVPLRQDVAVTGSVNQLGQVQPVGGVHHKVEGFFRTCLRHGPLQGHGVIVPAGNEVNLALHDGVAEPIAAGSFRLWSVVSVDEAVELMTGVAAGVPDAAGDYPPDSVYGRVTAQLVLFDRALAERERFVARA